MEAALLYILLASLLGLFVTWGVGANDVANAMGTSVGSRAITVKQAIVIAALFEFAGAFLGGGHVTATIRNGIIDASLVANPETLVFGMLAALAGAGVWLMVASYNGWPVSTTHTIVGALIGFGLVGVGGQAVEWDQVAGIVASWILSPLLGAAIAYLLAQSVRFLILESVHPLAAAKRYGPVYVFLMGLLVSLVVLWKGLAHIDVDLSTPVVVGGAVLVGLVTAGVGRALIARLPDGRGGLESQHAGAERVFAPLCVLTACAMAFAHGSNDVANGVGPMAAVVATAISGQVAPEAALPAWMLLLGGAGIVLGLATLGLPVMRTIGSRITELTPSRGFCAELAAASTVVIASRLGLPVSTTHIIVGAVLGVGLARGRPAIDLRVVVGIVASWVVTLPVGAGLAIAFFYAIRAVFS